MASERTNIKNRTRVDDILHELKPPPKKRFFDKRAELEEERLSKFLFGNADELVVSLAKPNISTPVKLSSYIETNQDKSNNDKQSKKQTPAWVDEEDAVSVATALDIQGRKLPDGGHNARSGQYSNLLKNKFTSIVGTPKWATLEREIDENSDDEILQTVGHLSKGSNTKLSMKTLEFKKLKDLNSQTYSEGPIVTCTEFHPTSSVGLVAGLNGIVSLYSVDGRKNEKLHSVAFDHYPIHCARFSLDGSEVILGGQQKYFHIYDLMAANTFRVPLPDGITHMKVFETSSDGNFIAVAGRWGEVYLLSAKSKELIASLRQGTVCTALTFSPDSTKLYGHGSESEITVWDLSSRRVCHKFTDDGCISGSSISISASGQYLASGSAQGVVNIYHTKDLTTALPMPFKYIMNLRTAITSLCFNNACEMLSIISSDVEDAVRIIHLPSATVFSNFPGFQPKIGRPTKMNFSPGNGYFALANNKSTVKLFRLKHYQNY